MQGVLTFKHKPLSGAELVFHPQDPGPGWMPVATTDAEGAYAASTRLPADGVPPGRYKVTAVWKPIVDENGDGPNRLPRNFSDPATTPLEVNAVPGLPLPLNLVIAE